MDFAGFCYEAVRAFLRTGQGCLLFVLMYGAAGGGFLLRAFVRRVSRGFPGGTYHAVGMNFGKER
ncbi:hypothetical protein D5274_17340 [bacterium 1XD42-94]|nr:hypothetical protein [bacterium 1XD42-94]